MNRRTILTALAFALVAGPAAAQGRWRPRIVPGDKDHKNKRTTAYVDFRGGRYYPILNGRPIGSLNGYSTEAEAWAVLRRAGA